MNKLTNNFSVLIIGGDSVIGKQLGVTLDASGISAWKTSRRQSNQNINTHFLDLDDISIQSTQLPITSAVVLCGGIAGYASCSKNPAMAAQINVVNTVKLASRFLSHKCHVIFLSSAAAVGQVISPAEDGICAPQTVYGALKRATELGLESEAKKYNAPLSILRLTKVISWSTPFIDKWLTDSLLGLPIKAFGSRLISPVTVEYVCKALMKLLLSQSKGVFHLSGEKVTTYYELAELMKEMNLLPNAVVHNVMHDSSEIRDGSLDTTFLPITKSTRDLGIEPESLDSILSHLKMTMKNVTK